MTEPMRSRTGPESRPLADLLEATARGDRAAFDMLYQATAPKLFGVILRISRNRADAEDVLQTTFLKVWQNAQRYSSESGRPIAWLCALARNAAIDKVRAEKAGNRADVVIDADMLARIAAPQGADAAELGALRACLHGLDEEARDSVLLAYCWGLSRDDLAARLGRPVNTVKTLLHRSLKALARCLEAP